MSTREVEGVLSLVDFLQQVNVYGVSVPGAAGSPHFKPTAALWGAVYHTPTPPPPLAAGELSVTGWCASRV